MTKLQVGLLLTLSLVSVVALCFHSSKVENCKSILTNNITILHRYVKPFPPISSRNDLAKFLESEKLKVGAELGVQSGYFALTMLNNWPTCTKYYLVDVWRQLANYVDFSNVEDASQETLYEQTKNALKKWENKTTFLRMLTSEAVKYIDNYSLDFLYIDARHDYCGTKTDLELYWPKLRPGGILAGHDFKYAEEVVNGQDWSICSDGNHHPGAVRGAVEEFAKLHTLQIVTTWKDSWESWIIRKPE
jgi:Methyltransferase domain